MTKTWIRAKRGDKNLLIECACGCGGIRHLFDHKRRIHSYISGHNAIGKRSGYWKTGFFIDRKGYKRVWVYDRYAYVSEHRLVYERHHKCCLLSGVDIHHIDGERTNNNISNLEAMMHRTHSILENGKGKKATIFCKGHVPWSKGKKLERPSWNKGKPWSPEMRQKIGLAIKAAYGRKRKR